MTKKKSRAGKKPKGKEVKPKRTRVSKEKSSKKEVLNSKKDLKEKEEKVNLKKSLLSQNKKLEFFDKNTEESNQNSKSFFGRIFSIFKKKKVERDFKKEELEDARKKLELELGKKLKNIHKRDYSKNPINFEDDFEDEKKNKTINKKTLFSNLKKTSLGQIFFGLDSKMKKAVVEKISSLTFGSYSEFEDFVAFTLSDLLMDSYTEISNKIIELIKSGGEVGKLSLESMEIPLKIDLFKTTKSKKDFEKIEDMIKKLNYEFLKMKKFSEEQKEKSIYSESFFSELKKEGEGVSKKKSKDKNKNVVKANKNTKKESKKRVKKNYKKNLKNKRAKKKKTNSKKKVTKKQRHSKKK